MLRRARVQEEIFVSFLKRLVGGGGGVHEGFRDTCNGKELIGR